MYRQAINNVVYFTGLGSSRCFVAFFLSGSPRISFSCPIGPEKSFCESIFGISRFFVQELCILLGHSKKGEAWIWRHYLRNRSRLGEVQLPQRARIDCPWSSMRSNALNMRFTALKWNSVPLWWISMPLKCDLKPLRHESTHHINTSY